MATSFLGVDPIECAQMFERLAEDLRKLAAGHQPDLGAPGTPHLRHWGVTRRPVTCLTGHVYGHPLLGDDRTCVTSEIFALDREQRWVRTMSRFYELGSAGVFGAEE